MTITNLALQNFRAHKTLTAALGNRTLILGDNASGKSTILEAIHALSTHTSFRAPNDSMLINLEQAASEPTAVARVRAQVEYDQKPHKAEVRFILQKANGNNTFRKEILEDGAKRQPKDAIGLIKSIVLAPQTTQIITGTPDERRRHINIILAQAIPGYAAALIDYTAALAQRNAALKLIRERGGNPAMLAPWDSILVEKGAQLIYERVQAVDQLSQRAAQKHRALTGESEFLRIVYLPSFDPTPAESDTLEAIQMAGRKRARLTLDDIKREYGKALSAKVEADVLAGWTTIGPHRDDFHFLINGIDIDGIGSRGQIRTAILAINLAEADWTFAKTGVYPILLLDDVFAELDADRRARFAQEISAAPQIIIAATDASFVPDALRGEKIIQL